MSSITKLDVIPTSLVTKDDLQKVVLRYECGETAWHSLNIYNGQDAVVQHHPVAFSSGSGETDVMLPVQPETFDAVWVIEDKAGNILYKNTLRWKKPREWTLYIMVSSHTDIGLHNSPYIQRHNSSRFIDEAAALCDATEQRDENDRYRYTREGTWFWNNYGMNRGRDAAKRMVEQYIKPGKIGACCGVAGNHIQTYGLEEMCRSTYERRRMQEEWDVSSETLSMVDNNGLPMSMIQSYADAGYKNIIFSPNQWNPLSSTIWKRDIHKPKYIWNTSAGGGGSRIDLRPESALPMVFNWESAHGEKLTVWGCSHYTEAFGIFPTPERRPLPLNNKEWLLTDIEERLWPRLEMLEGKYPYDLWLLVCYWDDQKPDLYVTDQISLWNSKWKWPRLRTLGNPDEPFNLLRERFGDQIPVLRGDITGGWYQHPLSVPDLLAQKFEADRALPNAEKWASIAGLTDEQYTYPATDFRRAWDALLFNDEHSYGTSGYQGRKVYETWMQHRDWIEKAAETAQTESALALRTIASHIGTKEDSIVVFNPTAQKRTEYVEAGQSYALADVPPFGYRVIPKSELKSRTVRCETGCIPPVIENAYYKIQFSQNGSMASIYDKELGRELLDVSHTYRANELVYTRDNHQTFVTPSTASFEVQYENEHIHVRCTLAETSLGAEMEQRVTLPLYEKRIDIENRLHHVRDLINLDRYKRYLYCAFPFAVEGCRRLCHMNGAVAEYARDVTGHGTDVYMSVNEWCCSENDAFGIALLMKDSHIVEFDHIHPDKTDFGNTGDGSQMFVYLANDWLQRHTPGGSHLDFRFRYAIVSYTGGYQAARIPQLAERYVNPPECIEVPAQKGEWPGTEHRFLPLPDDLRFLCLKRADDGEGLIARFYGEGDRLRMDFNLPAELSTTDERLPKNCPVNGFLTCRLGRESIRIPERIPSPTKASPAPIGSVYTGLITKPCAAAGENMGHLYLLWGTSTEADFSHYRLYRSESQGFEPDENTFVAEILPEEYCVARYEDTGLKDHTCYYYRVCAVNQLGVQGTFSDEFCAWTREMLTDTAGINE